MKKYAPAANRNRQPILDVLKENIPPQGNILEIASGSGEHALFFASEFPLQQWIPSDRQPECIESIKAWRNDYQGNNLQPPLLIDVMKNQWYKSLTLQPIKTIVCINMIHIAPWQAYLGLMEGAKNILPVDGIVYLYGPYKIDNQHTAPSNQEFDRSLQARDSSWGVRNLEDVLTIANNCGFVLKQKIAMPANNFSIILQKKDNS